MKKIVPHLVPATLAGLLSLSFAATQAMAQTTPPPAPAATPAAPAAPETPEHTFVPKISLYSEYEYRGISQTSEKPALQLNLDYSHSSGFYAGAFLTNIKWLKDYKDIGAVKNYSSVELDLFGGFKFEVIKDVTLDVGVLHYDYPNMTPLPKYPKANTNEVYVGATYSFFNVKYSYSTGGTFGVPLSKGSTFIELNYSQEIMPKLTVMAQVAKQQYKGRFEGFDNDKELTYTVFKVGGSYDLGDGWTAGGYYKDTDAKPANYTVKGRDWSKGRLVAFVSKSF